MLRKRRREDGVRVESFREFVGRVNPRYVWYRHCEVMASVLQRVADGELGRVMMFMPPRHGKSEQVSRMFPAYFLQRHPHQWAGVASYNAELAYTFSRAARRNYTDDGRELEGDAAAVKQWETGKGGGFWAAGVGGPITGKGAHLGGIDDPTKNQEEAASSTIRESHKEWWRSTFYTRLEPNGAAALTMTRWHEDDLAGWLLNEDEQDSVEPWHIVDLPAIFEGARHDYPANCTVEPDWREPGEALCPERYPVERLERIRQTVGDSWWEALYQQRPSTTVNKGRVYYNFTDKNVRTCKDLGGDLWVGMDFNVAPMSAVVGSKAGDELHLHGEILLGDSGTEEMAEALKLKYPNRRINVCPDPSGNSRKTSAKAGETDFSILRSHKFLVHAPPSAPPVVDRINEVNTLCGGEAHATESGQAAPAGRPRLFMDPQGCRKTIKAMKKLGYKPGTGVVDKGGGNDHPCDATGYLVHHLFPIVVRRSTAGSLPFGGG
jgi:hypothetical protein